MPEPGMPPDRKPVGKGYALWLSPVESMFHRLASEISRLSCNLSTPRFEPHITLLAGIKLPEEKVLAKSAALAACLKPMRIELGDIGYLDEYFKCLFVTVIPGNSIIKAHNAARRLFGGREGPFMPHLSLVYGKFPAETKKGIAASLSSLRGEAFGVSSLAVCRVSGAPCVWKCIKRFELG